MKNEIQERILVQTSVINYLVNRMDNIKMQLRQIVQDGKIKANNAIFNEQIKATDDWLNAVDMQLTKVCNELGDFVNEWDMIEEDELPMLDAQMEFINSKIHPEL